MFTAYKFCTCIQRFIQIHIRCMSRQLSPEDIRVRCSKVCTSKFGRCFSGKLNDTEESRDVQARSCLFAHNTRRYLPNLWFSPTGKYRKFVRRLGEHLKDRILAFSFPLLARGDFRTIKGTTNCRRISPRVSSFFSPRLLQNYYFIEDLRVLVLWIVTDPKI